MLDELVDFPSLPERIAEEKGLKLTGRQYAQIYNKLAGADRAGKLTVVRDGHRKFATLANAIAAVDGLRYRAGALVLK